MHAAYNSDARAHSTEASLNLGETARQGPELPRLGRSSLRDQVAVPRAESVGPVEAAPRLGIGHLLVEEGIQGPQGQLAEAAAHGAPPGAAGASEAATPRTPPPSGYAVPVRDSSADTRA